MKRFYEEHNGPSNMVAVEDGEWVRYEDAKTDSAEYDRMCQAVLAAEKLWDQALAEVERLRAQVGGTMEQLRLQERLTAKESASLATANALLREVVDTSSDDPFGIVKRAKSHLAAQPSAAPAECKGCGRSQPESHVADCPVLNAPTRTEAEQRVLDLADAWERDGTAAIRPLADAVRARRGLK